MNKPLTFPVRALLLFPGYAEIGHATSARSFTDSKGVKVKARLSTTRELSAVDSLVCLRNLPTSTNPHWLALMLP